MNKLHCKLILESNAEHCQQIYTGLADLAEEGFLDLEVEVDEKFNSQNFGKPMIVCYINEKIKIVFDTFDGQKLIDEDALEGADFYFKRSYDPLYAKGLRGGEKIYALGLNYLAYSKHSFWKERIFAANSLKDKLKVFFRSNKMASRFFNIQDSLYTCETSNFEGFPQINDNPKVLFLARAWKPDNVTTDEKKLERHRMNDQRADIIRTLKKHLGERFIGGFLKEAYALENYPDCVVSKNLTNKKNYLNIMKESDICIATKGLDDSIGWKFAEYVAASKAIVTEELAFALPGNFEENTNYLTFHSSDECVAQVLELIKNIEKRIRMMHQNYIYYTAYVKPKQLVLNALLNIYTTPKSKEEND